MKITQENLPALKLTEGKSVRKSVSEFDATNVFRGLFVCKNASDQSTLDNLKAWFHQALIDNIVRRFPATDLLQAAEVLNQSQLTLSSYSSFVWRC